MNKYFVSLSLLVSTATATLVANAAQNQPTSTNNEISIEAVEEINDPTSAFLTLDDEIEGVETAAEAAEDALMFAESEANDNLNQEEIAMVSRYEATPEAMELINYAAKYLGTPYVWGTHGPKTFDCSGFTSYVYNNFGHNLSRSSKQQYTQGRAVATKDIRPGDLLFFSSRSSGPGRVGHVAMAVSVDEESGAVKFIHASIKGVRYNTYPNDAYYKRNFIGARRILD